MATEVKHALCSSTYWTANQVAMEAIYGVGGYYTTIAAWSAAEVRDLVAADEIAILECYTGTYTGVASITGFTTDATRYVLVKAAAGHEHLGVRGAGVIHSSSLSIYDDNVTIQDIEVISGATYGMSSNNSVHYKRLIVEQTTGIGGTVAIYSNGFSATAKDSSICENCISIGGENGIQLTRGWSVLNCTSIGAISLGMSLGPNTYSANNIVEDGTGTSGFNASSYGHSHNLFTKNAAIPANTTDSWANFSVYDLFTDYDNEDFSLKTDAFPVNQGLDVSGYFTDDVTGYGRA